MTKIRRRVLIFRRYSVSVFRPVHCTNNSTIRPYCTFHFCVLCAVLVEYVVPNSSTHFSSRYTSKVRSRLAVQEGSDIIMFETLKPSWNEVIHAWTLNFNGRVKIPSKKNFLVSPEKVRNAFRSWGRTFATPASLTRARLHYYTITLIILYLPFTLEGLRLHY